MDQQRFHAIAKQLIADIRAAADDAQARAAHLQTAVDAIVKAHREDGDDTPLEELMIPERLGEDDFDDGASVLELAAGDSEELEFELREAVGDLCGY